jgi:hypothetical protein
VIAALVIAWCVLAATALVAMRISAGGGWSALRASWTGEPHCPACRIGMIQLESRPFPQRSYHVWVCLRCANALALPRADGTEPPECASCHQRSMLVPLWRLPPEADGEPRVQVHESCPVCGHHAIEDLPDVDGEPELAEVIPFPKPRQATE